MRLFLGRGVRLEWSLSAAALGLVWMASVEAQQAPSSASASPANGAVAQPETANGFKLEASGEGQSSGKLELEEIVVTAQKRSATVLETPLSITAVSGADILRSRPDRFRNAH